MPCVYDIDAQREIVLLTLSGEVTGSTFTDTLRLLLADPRWTPGYARVWNGRGIQACCVTLEEVDGLFRFLDADPARARSRGTAFVATRDTDRILFQLFKAKTKGWTIDVFRSMDEAYAWLERLPQRAPDAQPSCA